MKQAFIEYTAVKQLLQAHILNREIPYLSEALLGINFDKRHGLETATREPRTGDERQTTPAK